MLDVLIVSLGATGGLRAADEELLASIRRAGATAEIVRADPPPRTRTLMLTDLRWALAARSAAAPHVAEARAIVYSTTTAALLWQRPGAIRFDAPAAGNRPGRHGLWQRPLERRRLREASLLLPWSAGALREVPAAARPAPGSARALVLPVPVEPSGPHVRRDIAAFTYAAHPAKKGLDRVLDAWRQVRLPGEELVVAGAPESELRRLGYAVDVEGVQVLDMLPYDSYRALLRRSRVFFCAARREDYGIAQLEALADGCMLVTVPSPGPYAALEPARQLDERLVDEDLGVALRTALDDPLAHYSERALRVLAPFRREASDRVVAEELLPRLLACA